MKYFDDNFLSKLSRLKSYKSMEPATVEEIEAVESSLGVVFPQAYREFLLLVGRDAGKFWDYDGDLKHISELNEYVAKDLMPRNGIVKKESDLIIAMVMDYACIYLRHINIDENPPVYLLMEGEREGDIKHKKESDSFSDYVNRKLDLNIRYYTTDNWWD